MFSLFGKKKESIEVPEWASFFSHDKYTKFISIVETFFKNKKLKYIIVDGAINLPEEKSSFNNLGLVNVAQLCNQIPAAEWEKVISDHYENSFATREFENEFNKNINNFEYIKPFLGVRLYHISYITQTIGKDLVIGNDLSEDIFKMLVFDFPTSIRNVKPTETTNWGKSIAELFEIGINNIKSNYPVELSIETIKDFKIWFAQGNHFFVPNIIFDLKNNLQLVGSKGSLIGIPHRGATIIYPIETIEIVKAISSLIPIIYGMNKDGPGSISNKLYWCHDDSWVDLPYKFEDNKLEFFPPENFVDFLNTLKGA